MLPKKYFIGKIRTYNITFPLYKSNKQTAITKEQKVVVNSQPGEQIQYVQRN